MMDLEPSWCISRAQGEVNHQNLKVAIDLGLKRMDARETITMSTTLSICFDQNFL